MDKFGKKLEDYSALSRRLAQLKLKLEGLSPSNHIKNGSRLATLEEILGLNGEKEQGEFSYADLKQYVVKYVPDLSQRLELLEKILGVEEVEQVEKKDKQDFSYPEIKKFIVKHVPDIGHRVELLENALGLSENYEKKQDFFTYLELMAYVRKYVPRIGEKVEYIEKLLNIKEDTKQK